MMRALRTIRTVMLVAIALLVLAAVGLFGWWTAIAPDCRSIWGNPDARCIAAGCRGLTVVLDARCTVGRPQELGGGRSTRRSGPPPAWSTARTVASGS